MQMESGKMKEDKGCRERGNGYDVWAHDKSILLAHAVHSIPKDGDKEA